MYAQPPSIIVVNSGALVAGALTTVALATPGVGFRYRIASWSWGVPRNAAAGTGIDFVLLDSLGGRYWQINGYSFGGKSSEYINFPEPGLPLAPNTGLSFQAIATVAGGIVTYSASYFVDSIS